MPSEVVTKARIERDKRSFRHVVTAVFKSFMHSFDMPLEHSLMGEVTIITTNVCSPIRVTLVTICTNDGVIRVEQKARNLSIVVIYLRLLLLVVSRV